MSDAIDTYVNKRQRQAVSNSSYAQELGQVYLNNGVEIDLDYVINENANPSQTPELSKSEMITNPNWIYASKELYNAFKPPEIDQTQLAPEDIGMETFAAKAPSTDAEFAAWGVEFVGMLEHNLGNLAIRTASIPDMTDAQKISMGYMLNQFGKLPMFSWNGTKRFFKGVISDPTTWASLGTFPLFVHLGKAGARRVTNEGLKTLIRNGLSANAIAAYEGGGYTGAFDYLKQSAIVAGEQAAGNTEAAIDPLQTGLATAAGAALGPVLQEGIPMAAGAAVRGGQQIASATGDAVQRLAQAAKQRKEERGSGVTLRSGIDPTEVVDDALALLAKNEPSPIVDELGFFSRLSKAASELKQEKATGRQYLGMLKNAGVSDTEIKATKLDLLLDNDYVYTKDEIGEVIENYRPRISEQPRSEALDTEGNVGMIEFEDSAPLTEDTIDHRLYIQEEVDYRADVMRDVLTDDPEFSNGMFRVMSENNPERYPPDEQGWKDRILDAWGPNLADNMPSTTMSDIDEALTKLGREFYDQDPHIIVKGKDHPYEIIGNDSVGYQINFEGRNIMNVSDLNEAKIKATEHFASNSEQPYTTKTPLFGDYKLDGGENYTELVFENPNSPTGFNTSHWGKQAPNYVAHARTTDRTDDLGRKILFVEEVQSDLNKSIRDKAKFVASIEQNLTPDGSLIPEATLNNRISPETLAEIKAYNSEDMVDITQSDLVVDWDKSTEQLIRKIEDEGFGIPYSEYRSVLQALKNDEPVWLIKFDPMPSARSDVVYQTSIGTPSFKQDVDEAFKLVEQQKARIEELKKEPFADTDRYTQMAIRRLIAKAVQEGYDGLAFTPGNFQASQYGQREGQIAFYDRILPKQIKQVLKKVDKNMQLGQTKISELESYYDPETAAELGMADYNVPYLDLSQAGKARVQQEGLPIMETAIGLSTAAALGGAATQGQGESANAN